MLSQNTAIDFDPNEHDLRITRIVFFFDLRCSEFPSSIMVFEDIWNKFDGMQRIWGETGHVYWSQSKHRNVSFICEQLFWHDYVLNSAICYDKLKTNCTVWHKLRPWQDRIYCYFRRKWLLIGRPPPIFFNWFRIIETWGVTLSLKGHWD